MLVDALSLRCLSFQSKSIGNGLATRKLHLVRCLAIERTMRHLRVVLDYVKLDQSSQRRHVVEMADEQPSAFQITPPALDQGI